MPNKALIQYWGVLLLAFPAANAHSAQGSIQFDHLELAHGHAIDGVKTAAFVEIDGKSYPLQFRPLLRTGQRLTGEIFGLIKDIGGNPLRDDQGEPLICRTLSKFGAGPDFTSLLTHEGRLFAATQFECAPGATYVTPLIQHQDSGLLEAAALRFADNSEVGGGMYHCAGSLTPWGTHLGSEELEPNARTVDPLFETTQAARNPLYAMSAYVGAADAPNPYAYGWITELRVTSPSGDSRLGKHFALGRFSHELAYVLPDQKTVYMTDDTTNGALFMFIADQAGQLDSGTLYAARWHQLSSENGGSADLDWINLGHAGAAQISAFVAKRPRFSHLFYAADPTTDGSCPSGFGSINTHDGHECLRTRDGMELLASRLEARRFAALAGASTEFRKAEGLTFSETRNKVYMAVTEIASGMLDQDTREIGGPNHIRLDKNVCGALYELDLRADVNDNREQPIQSQSVAVLARAILAGKPVASLDDRQERGSCDVDSIANPDNISLIPEADTLLIAEDSDLHWPNVLWAYQLADGALHRILAAPKMAEITSVYWYPDLNGWAYATVVIQHPWMRSGGDIGEIPLALRHMTESIVGYLGPFPATIHVDGSHNSLPRQP